MKKLILFAAICYTCTATAQDPIFDPGMTITEFGIVSSPLGEEVDKIIDGNFNTKFLDFELADGMGFEVDLGGVARAASSIDLTTANDFPVRDPIDFAVLGSNDGSGYTTIGSGTIDCIPDRFNTRSYTFTNSTDFLHYRVNFTAPCDPTGGTGIPSIQLAEVQLFEEILNISELQLSANQLSIYPNPSSGSFNVDYIGNVLLNSLEIIDVSGKIILTEDLTRANAKWQLNLGPLRSGIYFLKVNSDSNSVTKKVVIR